MNKAFEKILERLDAKKQYFQKFYETEGKAEEDEYINKATQLAFDDAKNIVQEVAEEYNGGWIACSERLPNDCDTRFYMCIVENHEEDLPMFCQYEEECGFGFWQDIYDEHTLGFVESIFNTNEELGYEKVIAWQPLPEPFKE